MGGDEMQEPNLDKILELELQSRAWYQARLRTYPAHKILRFLFPRTKSISRATVVAGGERAREGGWGIEGVLKAATCNLTHGKWDEEYGSAQSMLLDYGDGSGGTTSSPSILYHVVIHSIYNTYSIIIQVNVVHS